MAFSTVEVLLPTGVAHGFDYAVPEGMALNAGDYVRVPFGSRELPGVVWGAGTPGRNRLKDIAEHYSHLPSMPKTMRNFIAWAAAYNLAPQGGILKMALPVAEALKAPSARERPLLPGASSGVPEYVLSGEQDAAAKYLNAKLDAGFSVTLLDGVTGSGKTEVYFDAIARAVGHPHSQTLVLLPEISLSVQWLARFERRFGFQPLVWHSGLPPGRRKHTWRAIVNGEAPVVVGARSALFLPYRNLRLIVMDEEHEGSYKQEDGVVYQARDMAVARARIEQIPAMLVSATPSLETVHNVSAGRYGAVHLHARHAGAEFPQVELIDMKTAALERGAFIAQPLRAALAETLARGHQSLLFLNRRGYAPLTLCRACGHRFQCPQCTAWLVLHLHAHGKQSNRRGNLMCHHCGYTLPSPDKCPACQAEETLYPVGPGVQRIAEEVAQFLPQARTLVMASDSAESHEDIQAKIGAMERGEADILIGTQMVAKGHHFANLALVGVVDADMGLSGGDPRAAERTYQLLHQLSGRAGRERVAGRVLVQSFQPNHPVMQALSAGDRARFMALELAERERGRLPPFARLAAVIVEGVHEDAAAKLARELARAAPKMEGVEVLGPAPAPLYMLRGKYRHRLLLRTLRQVNIQKVLEGWLAPFKTPANLRIKVDVDPQSFL